MNYYQLNQATVTDPSGNAYMLGSAATSGLSNPSIGRFTGSAGGPFAPAVNVSATDTGSIPFGTGAGGFFALTSNLPMPNPNTVNPEGPYYWWTVAGNTNGANLRLDQNPQINPTGVAGTYRFDLEGLVFCSGGTIFFDASMRFTVSPSQVILNIVKTGDSSPNSCSSATGAAGSVENSGTIAYSVTVSNTGTGAATGVVVSDPQPSGESFGAASATSPTLTQSGGVGSWSWTGTITAGASVTITWTATVSTSAASVTNVATITSPTASSTVTINGNPANCETTVLHPAITVVKSVSPNTVDDLQDNTISVSALVTNTGDTPLSGITISDTLSSNISCPSATLAVGASETCTGTYVIPKGDSSSSSTDTVTVTGADSSGTTVTASDHATVTIVHPAITVIKSVSPSTVSNLQDNTITVSALVTNAGDTPLSGITISDTLSSNISCPSATLAVGASETCTGTYVIPKGTSPGSSTDTVTVTGTDSVGGTVTGTSSATVTITSSELTVVKSVSPTTVDDLQDNTISVSALVTNTGGTTISGISISDTLSTNMVCPSTTLAPGASMTCTGSYVIPKGDSASSSTDTVTVTGTDSLGNNLSASSSATVTIIHPAITVVKTVSPTTVDNMTASTISISALVTNTGDTTLTGVGVTDTLAGALTCPSTTLLAGASETCTGSYVISKGDTASTSPDTVTASGTDSVGGTVTATSSASVTIIHPAIKVIKTVSPTTVNNNQDNTITVSALITNTGDTTLTGVGAVDSLAGALSCPSTTLLAGASETCTGSYVIPKGTTASTSTDTVTVTGTDSVGGTVTSSDHATVTIVQAPQLVTQTNPATITLSPTSTGQGTLEVEWVGTGGAGSTHDAYPVIDTATVTVPSTVSCVTATGTNPASDIATVCVTSLSPLDVTVTNTAGSGADIVGVIVTAPSGGTVSLTSFCALVSDNGASPGCATPQSTSPGQYSYWTYSFNVGSTVLTAQALGAGTSSGTGGTQCIIKGCLEHADINTNDKAVLTGLAFTPPTPPPQPTVTDTATVSGGSSQLAGNVQFALFAGTSCAGTPIFTSTVPLGSISGGTGTATSSPPFSPSGGWTPGTYTWQASFTATDTSDTSIAAQCGGANEVLTVTSSSAPQLTTQTSPSTITLSTTTPACSLSSASSTNCDFVMSCTDTTTGGVSTVNAGDKITCIAEDLDGSSATKAGSENGHFVIFTVTPNSAVSSGSSSATYTSAHSYTAVCQWNTAGTSGAPTPAFCTADGKPPTNSADPLSSTNLATFTVGAGFSGGAITISAIDYTGGTPSAPGSTDGSDLCGTGPAQANNVCSITLNGGGSSGQLATDTATVSGGSSQLAGTVSYALFAGTACTGTPVFTQTGVPLVVSPPGSGTGMATSSGAIPPGGWALGTYTWQVSFTSTDSADNSIGPVCGGANETITVNSGSTLSCTSVTSSIASNFNANAIPAGDYIWFNAVFKMKSPVPPSGLTITFTGQTISFTAGGVPYTLSVPDSKVIFSPTATSGTTTFTGGMWVTTVPASFTDNVFLSGLAFPVPAGGLPGGINPVTWSGTFNGDASFTVNWQWAAAVYTHFTTDYNSLGIKPLHSGTLDSYHNGDQAGTPEGTNTATSPPTPWKSYVVGGARGGGGSNFTGSYSPTATAAVKCQ